MKVSWEVCKTIALPKFSWNMFGFRKPKNQVIHKIKINLFVETDTRNYPMVMRNKFSTFLSDLYLLATVKLTFPTSFVTHIRLAQAPWLPGVLISLISSGRKEHLPPSMITSPICASSRYPLWRWDDNETSPLWDFFFTTSPIIAIYSPNGISLFYLRYF